MQTLSTQGLLNAALHGMLRLIQHVMACAWYYVGTASDVDGWVSKSGAHDANFAYRYTISLYWMFCCFGFGVTETEPGTQLEVSFAIAAAIVGLAIFALLLDTITSNSALLSQAAEEYRQQFRQLRRFLVQAKVDADLRLRVTHFLERAYALSKGRPEPDAPILALLSKPLQRELQFARYEGCLREVGFSKHLSRVSGHHPAELLVLRYLATHAISHQSIAASDAVFESGTVARAMHFSVLGQLSYSVDGRPSTGVREGCWVSEMVWTPWLHCGDLTTIEESSVVSLLEKEFSGCIQRFWDFFMLAKNYASDYVSALNEQTTVTDLWGYHSEVDKDDQEPPTSSPSMARKLWKKIVPSTGSFDRVAPVS